MRQQKFPSFFLFMFFVLGVGMFAGCAGMNQGRYDNAKLDVSYPQSTKTSLQGFDNSIEDRQLKKDLSKMTSEELEREGDIYLSRRNFHMAYLNYEKALQKDPDDLGIHYKKGACF